MCGGSGDNSNGQVGAENGKTDMNPAVTPVVAVDFGENGSHCSRHGTAFTPLAAAAAAP